ncbi:MAG: T9SS type A sorting domain-containing protein [Ferruginibacter sp.]
MKQIFLLPIFILTTLVSFSQNGWSICNAPEFTSRVDDVFMVNAKTGYAVCGDGQIVKTTDGGSDWFNILTNDTIYCRSVEFMNEQKGFVGGFKNHGTVSGNGYQRNVLRMTTDGGTTWTDITDRLNPKANGGICGLSIIGNTIYGCGNWYEDSAYIVKSIDGGDTWSFIDMKSQAAHLIDLNFINENEGFATGSDIFQRATILHTIDGGHTWTTAYVRSGDDMEYCWKIQRLSPLIYFVSIESISPTTAPKVLKSIDGGMSWTIRDVYPTAYNIEGIGFLNELKGWTGGDEGFSFETNDGGVTWDTIHVCPEMNHVFRVNDTLVLATGTKIWKYSTNAAISVYAPDTARFAWVYCYPNPVKGKLNVDVYIKNNTRIFLGIFDQMGRKVRSIENADKEKGYHKYYVNTEGLSNGIYYVVLKTHDEKRAQKIIVGN